MGDRTSVTTDAAGRRVMAKVARTSEEGSRLEREARQLQAAAHPGVVELVGLDGHGVGSILLTAHVDGPTLASVGLLPIEEGAGLLAALATTLADLHQLGLVHGAVAPEHVVVGPAGRPVLCSFGYGGREGDPAGPAPNLPAAFDDPARSEGTPLTAAVDVFALGALARVVAPSPPAGHALARAADDAMRDDPADRPTARAVAELLQREVPSARLPRGLPSPTEPAIRPRPGAAPADALAAWRHGGGLAAMRRPSPSRRLVVAGTLALVGVVGGAALLLAGRSAPTAPALIELAEPAPGDAQPDPPPPGEARPDPPPPGAAQPRLPPPGEAQPRLPPPGEAQPRLPPPGEAQPDPPTTRAGLTSSPTTTPPLRAALPAGCSPATAVLQADVDGDGCPEALRYADGVLQAGPVRWSLGRPGDQVATGDWTCQGVRTVALFRPSTGELFRFDGWAETGRDISAPAVARVLGGQALRAADLDRDGCHEAVVERATGAAEVVRLPRPQP